MNDDPALAGLPHWGTLKQLLPSEAVVPSTPMDPEIDKLTAAALDEVLFAGKQPREALAFAQTEGQRLLDQFWAGVG